MNNKLVGFETIDYLSKELFDLSQYLFSNPELAFQETKAHNYLCNLFVAHGFIVDKNFVHETGFRAIYETSPKPHFAILVEYDALPNIGHACGHNLIAESSVATALGLQSVMKNGALCKLTVFGTPAEEGGGGKLKFISDGHFVDIDACMMSHPSPSNVLHVNHLALIGLTVTYTGKESHASIAPWNGMNALDAAVLAYQSISCLRQQIKPDCRVHGIITNGGSAPNIIPNHTEMKYLIRSPDKICLRELLPRIQACLESAATMTGCQVKIVENCPFIEDLNSNAVLMDIFHKNALQLGISFDKSSDINPSSDVGNVSQVCPTIQPTYYIGTKTINHTVEFAACAKTEEAHLFTLQQAKAMLGVFVDIIEDDSGRLLKEIKESFDANIVL